MKKETKDPKIYFSYNVKDKEIANEIISYYKKNNLNIISLEDYLKPGELFVDGVLNTIEAADIFVLIISENYIKSNLIEVEIQIVLEEMKKRDVIVLPIKIDDCEIPSLLRNFYWLNLKINFESNLEESLNLIAKSFNIDYSKLNYSTFSNLVEDILIRREFENIRIPSGIDLGYDMIADFFSKDPIDGFKKEIWIIELKLYQEQKPNIESLQQMVSYLQKHKANYNGLIITTGQFTSAALKWLNKQINRNLNIRIIDGPKLRRILLSFPDLIIKYFTNREEMK